MAEDDIVIKMSANIEPLLASLKKGDKAVEALIARIKQIDSATSGPGANPAVSKITQKMQALESQLNSGRTSVGRKIDGITGDLPKNLEAEIAKLGRLADAIDNLANAKRRLSTGNAGGVGAPLASSNKLLAQVANLPVLNQLRAASENLKSINAAIPGASAAEAPILKQGRAEWEAKAKAAYKQLSDDVGRIAKASGVSAKEHIDALTAFGRLAGEGKGASFQSAQLNAIKEVARERVKVTSAKTLGQFGREIMGTPLRDIGAEQRAVIAKVYKDAGLSVGAVPVKKEPVVKPVTTGQGKNVYDLGAKFEGRDLSQQASNILTPSEAKVLADQKAAEEFAKQKGLKPLTKETKPVVEASKAVEQAKVEAAAVVQEKVAETVKETAKQVVETVKTSTKKGGKVKAPAGDTDLATQVQEALILATGKFDPKQAAELTDRLGGATGVAKRNLSSMLSAAKKGQGITPGQVSEVLDMPEAMRMAEGMETPKQYANRIKKLDRQKKDAHKDVVDAEKALSSFWDERIKESKEIEKAAAAEISAQKKAAPGILKELGLKTRPQFNAAESRAREAKAMEFMNANNADPARRQLLTRQQEELQARRMAQKVPAAEGEGGRSSTFGKVMKTTMMYGGASFMIYGAISQAKQFFDTMVKMDKQLADLRKTLGGTDKDFSALMVSATNIARSYKGGTQDVLDAMEMFSSQFKSKSSLEELSKAAIIFSNISGQTLKGSVETIISTMQQFNMSVSDSAHITDSWASLSANAAVSIADLGNAVGAAGGAAVAAGVSFDKFNALVTVITSSTSKSGKEAGNALKRIFERYSADENIKELDKLGIHVKTAGGEFRTFEDVIDEVATGTNADGKKVSKSWSEMSDSQKKSLAVLFAGAKQYDGFLAIMNNYNKVLKLTTISQNSQGEAQRQNARLSETFAKQMQQVGVEYDKLARTAGTVLLPILSQLLSVFTTLLKTFNDAPEGIQKATIALGSLALAITAVNTAMKIVGFSGAAFGAIGSKLGIGGAAGGAAKQAGSGILNTIAGTVLGNKLSSKLFGTAAAGAGEIAAGAGTAAYGNIAIGAGAGTGTGMIAGGGTASGGALASVGTAIAETVAGLTTLTTGLTLAAGAAVLVAAAWKEGLTPQDIISGWKEIAYGARDADAIIKGSSQEIIKGRQEAETLSGLGTRVAAAISDRKNIQADSKTSAAEKEKLLSENSKTITGILKDVGKERPDLLSKSGVDFDIYGNAVNINSDRLKQVADSLAMTANALEENTYAIAGKAGAEGAMATEKLTAGLGIGDPRRVTTSYVGGEGKTATDTANLGMRAEQLTALTENLQRSGFDFYNKSSGNVQKFGTFTSAVDLNRSGNTEVNQQLFDIVTSAAKTREASQTAFNPKLIDLIQQDRKNAERGPGMGTNFAQKFLDDINKVLTAGSSVPELLKIILPDLEKMARQGGVESDKDRRARIKAPVVDVPRIDFELQKTLTTNARNYQMFGGAEVNTVEGGISAIKKAMSDLANNTEMASGPKEELQKLDILRQRKVIESDIAAIGAASNKEGTKSSREKAMFVKELQLQALDEKQAIQGTTAEREKEKKVLQEQLSMLEKLQIAQEGIRAGLKGLVPDLMSGTRERAIALGQTTQMGDEGRGTLQVDKQYALDRLAQQEEINRREMQKAAASGDPNAMEIAAVNGRNAIKHIREEIAGIDRQMQDVLDKTDIWTNMLNKIGDSIIGKIADKIADTAVNSLSNMAGGGILSGDFLAAGQANPVENAALTANTSAINTLTAAILEANTQSHLTETARVDTGAAIKDTADATSKTADATANLATATSASAGQGQEAADKMAAAAEESGKKTVGATEGLGKKITAGIGGVIMGALAGGGLGAMFTRSQGRTGNNGATWGAAGGAIGAGISSVAGAFGGQIGLVGQIVGAVVSIGSGFIGSMFDKVINAMPKTIDELPPALADMNLSLETLTKSLNTVNDTMENLINAPSNFVLPIPKGILENSVTAQSALAMQAGGLILRSGPAYLHAGEQVVPARGSTGNNGGFGGGMNAVFNIDGSNSNPKEIAQEVMKVMNKEFSNQSQRGGLGYNTRF